MAIETFKPLLETLIQGNDLDFHQATTLANLMMTGQLNDAQISAALVLMRAKGESVDEIVAFAQSLMAQAVPIQTQSRPLIDTCGTGGDGACIFNVSTASAFVVAAAGGHVAKHGNRSVSGNSGSADVLEALGINIALTPDQVGRAIDSLGVGFLFAPTVHAAVRHVVPARKSLSVRTIFNLIGPLCNPANPEFQVIGVYSPDWVRPMADACRRLGKESVLVVHGAGLDELTLSATSQVCELRAGKLIEYEIQPSKLGLTETSLDLLKVANAKESAELITQSLKGRHIAGKEMLALNSAAALYISGKAESWQEAVQVALDVIDSGMVLERIKDLASFSQCFD